MADSIPFIDLQTQRIHLSSQIEAAIVRVLTHGGFIMGPEVVELERRLAEYSGVRHVITCANGTDALMLALMALGVGPGDAVIVPAFTFVATAEAAALIGAIPVFADVRESDFNLDPESLEYAIDAALAAGLTPRAVIPVDLFGQPADYGAFASVVDKYGLTIISDAAQSFGASLGNKRVGALAPVTTTSFFPAKPLGCYGDGGAVFTDDDALAHRLKSLRVHGQGSDKYDNERVGLNARLDTLQAAILLEKLAIFDEELEARQVVANRYAERLEDIAAVPRIAPDARSAWAQYTLRSEKRDAIAAACKQDGIPTGVYYPIPLNRQTGYSHYPVSTKGCPVSERLSQTVISLPMHPYLDDTTQDRIAAAVRRGLETR